MSPHIDATAIALLALHTEPRNVTMESRLDRLKRQANSCRTLWSLSWAILALDAYNEPLDALAQRLAALVKPDRTSDNATLAIVTRALECATRGIVFEVST